MQRASVDDLAKAAALLKRVARGGERLRRFDHERFQELYRRAGPDAYAKLFGVERKPNGRREQR